MAKAIVLLSGGVDSTVVLAMAQAQGKCCYLLSFDYNQRHAIELESAKAVASHYGLPHKIIRIDPCAFGKSSLVSDLEIPHKRSIAEINRQGIPSTYVPARNTLFLAYALGQCELYDAQEIHFGPNKIDHACYPDCRPAYLQAFQSIMNVATKQAIEGNAPKLVTPLKELDKTAIIKLGISLGAPLNLTWSCYDPLNSCKPCEACDACVLRQDGFAKAS